MSLCSSYLCHKRRIYVLLFQQERFSVALVSRHASNTKASAFESFWICTNCTVISPESSVNWLRGPVSPALNIIAALERTGLLDIMFVLAAFSDKTEAEVKLQMALRRPSESSAVHLSVFYALSNWCKSRSILTGVRGSSLSAASKRDPLYHSLTRSIVSHRLPVASSCSNVSVYPRTQLTYDENCKLGHTMSPCPPGFMSLKYQLCFCIIFLEIDSLKSESSLSPLRRVV